MTGDDFLALAGNLLTRFTPPGEASCRSAISRAYYGVFHLAHAYLTEIGIRLQRRRDHGEIWRCLMGSGHSDAAAASGLIQDLHSARVEADYDLGSKRVGQVPFAQRQIDKAADIASLLEKCRLQPARSLVKAGIEAYQQRISGGGPAA